MATRERAVKGAGKTTRSGAARRRSAATRKTPAASGPAAPQQTAGSASSNPWADAWTAFFPAPRAQGDLPRVGLSAERMLELQQDYVQRLTRLWTDFVEHPEKVGEPIQDSRFADPAWRRNPLASFYARAYLLNAEFLNRLADSVEADDKTKKRIRFAVSQFVDAVAPSNFLALNPQAQARLIETGGESLWQGIRNLLGDLSKGRITQTDESAFEVGRNVATTEGAVVYENELMQLIQYKPLTDRVYERPYVMIPPCINKYYILDLQPDNSLIRYTVEQGHTVFVVSWKNPHAPERYLTWDDYLEKGPIAAIHVAQEITGSKKVNALGFCVGGTIVACALAVMRARGEDPVSSLTLLTTLLDFDDTGVLDVFIDEAHVRMREQQMGRGGIMPGRELANTFNSLRARDLVWHYVVSNYLEGRQPPAFDLLYWNGDSTNLPGPMYTWYLRNTYLENNLRVPNKVTCCGVPVDLGRIQAPAYVFAAREDHIVPWKGAYASARLLGGGEGTGVRFVLGASGHIAGTINPPSKNKRSYWTGRPGALPADADAWLGGATEQPGSWWTDWSRWVAAFGGAQKAAPKRYGCAKYPVIEPAPGRYVKEKA